MMYKTYSAQAAQDKADYEKTAKGAPLKIGHNRALSNYIEDRILKDGYSPYAVAQEIKDNSPQRFETTLSTRTIYNYVDGAVFLRVRKCHLPRKNKSKKKPEHKRLSLNSVLFPSISLRDITRSHFGHWEMDTVVGKAAGKNSVLLVLTERKTRYEIIMKIKAKKAECVVAALQKLRCKHGKHFSRIFQSITVDNGCEFADYSSMEKFAPIYYCHPYSSWERGSNENANAMIRRWIPKGVDITSISVKRIQEIEMWLNNYPRKILDTTAQKAFDEEISKIF